MVEDGQAWACFRLWPRFARMANSRRDPVTSGSQVHFDYDSDGFAERTGWVKPDDGILVHDRNANGLADGIGELFGTVSADGFEVLALLDSNADGKISALDAKFSELRIWRDLNGNGAVDAGEMQSLAQAELASIGLNRADVAGTNEGHDRGFSGIVTRADGTTTTAETIYFETDRQSTHPDTTPSFTPAPGVDKLPQLPGSGQINSVAWKASNDPAFMAAWTALTDAAGTLSPDDFRTQFEARRRPKGRHRALASRAVASLPSPHVAFVPGVLGSVATS